MVITGGTASDQLRYLKSIATQLWLFGYELPGAVMRDHFPSSCHHPPQTPSSSLPNPTCTSSPAGRKVRCRKSAPPVTHPPATLLQTLVGDCKANTGVSITLHARPKGEDGTAQMNDVLAAIKAASDSPMLGTLPKEKPEGAFAATWQGVLDGSGLPTADVAAGLGECFSCKDPEEIKNVKKAAHLSASAMVKFAVPEIEEVIDSERRVKHSKLSEKTEEAITNPAKIQVKLRDDNVDIAYPPIFQSGGEYDLKARVVGKWLQCVLMTSITRC